MIIVIRSSISWNTGRICFIFRTNILGKDKKPSLLLPVMGKLQVRSNHLYNQNPKVYTKDAVALVNTNYTFIRRSFQWELKSLNYHHITQYIYIYIYIYIYVCVCVCVCLSVISSYFYIFVCTSIFPSLFLLIYQTNVHFPREILGFLSFQETFHFFIFRINVPSNFEEIKRKRHFPCFSKVKQVQYKCIKYIQKYI